MHSWDYSTDVLVVGSGGGGMTAALTAKNNNLDTIIIEKNNFYGGSTALSGGALWVPDNHLMKRAGIADSFDDAFKYLKTITDGKISNNRLKAYIKYAPEMAMYLEENSHLKFQIVPDYSDYYPNIDGGKPEGGRTIEPKFFNSMRLKSLRHQLFTPTAQILFFGKMMISAYEAKAMMSAKFSDRLNTIWMLLSFFLNPFRCLPKMDTRLSLGCALIGSLRLSLADRNVPILLDTAARRFITENGRVTGVEANAGEKPIFIQAKKGIILASGGFEKNQAMREEYQRQPVHSKWSMGCPENTGDVINMASELDVSLDMMDESWWMPVTLIPGNSMPWYTKDSWWGKIAKQPNSEIGWFVLVERSLPGVIVVNANGKRFSNEAAPYIDFVNMQRQNEWKGGNAVPSFMIADQKYHLKYPVGPVMPGMPVKKYIKSGFLKTSTTIEGLAKECGIDEKGLVEEVKKFNQFAKEGKDLDFHKGELPIERYYADPSIKPNPCLAPISKPPFYAMKIYPGDIGTKGGLLTDEYGRVINKTGAAIEGLYATGNCAASVMGATYPGAGGTIGPSMVFGYIAAQHIANKIR